MTLNFQTDTVYALSASAHYVYAARLSGLYRSADDGASWQNTFETLDQPLAATAVVAVGETVFAGVKGAVLRSDDAGANWHMAGLASPPPQVVALAVSPNFTDDGVIVAGTADDGVFVSTDGGMNWVAWNFGLLDYHIFALAFSPNFANDHTLYAGTESGIFRSHNNGRSWNELPFPMTAAPVLSLAATPQHLFAGTESSGVFSSEDGGASWQQDENQKFAASANALRASDTRPGDVLLLLEDSLHYSSNQGQTWEHRHSFPPEKSAMAFTVLGHSDHVLVGFADGSVQQLD